MKQYAFIFFILFLQINFGLNGSTNLISCGSDHEMSALLQEQQYRVDRALKIFLKILPKAIEDLEEQATKLKGKQTSVSTSKIIALVAKARKIQTRPDLPKITQPTRASNDMLVDQKNEVEDICSRMAEYQRELAIEEELLNMVAARNQTRLILSSRNKIK